MEPTWRRRADAPRGGPCCPAGAVRHGVRGRRMVTAPHQNRQSGRWPRVLVLLKSATQQLRYCIARWKGLSVEDRVRRLLVRSYKRRARWARPLSF